MNALKPNSVNEYIESFPKATQTLLKQIRAAIKKAAPLAEEIKITGCWFILQPTKIT